MRFLVVGGASGLGLSLSVGLINLGHQVTIADIKKPQFESPDLDFVYFNVVHDPFSDALGPSSLYDGAIYTAGLGRVDFFYTFSEPEINKTIGVNLLGLTRFLLWEKDSLFSKSAFYSACISSIAGMVSSPLFAVYGATKAYVHSAVESINAELAYKGFDNRVLDVCPGALKGTGFRGGATDLSSLASLADECIRKMLVRDTFFMPDKATYENVLERYRENPVRFGAESITYKISNGRIQNKPFVTIGYLSGTFDLFHVGHLNLLQRAKRECDYLIVGVHPDASHKGKTCLISFEDRKRIVKSVCYVDDVVDACPEDSDAWSMYHYHKLFVGSDYKGTERFERYESFFKDKGVTIIYFPYTKEVSSSALREKLIS